MAKIDFDGLKAKIKRNAKPLLAGITYGPTISYRLHGDKKKKKSKKRRRHPHSGYLGAWCPWWMDYDTDHGQHDPKFDPQKPTPTPDVPADIGGSGVAGGGTVAGGDAGGMAAGGGMVGESERGEYSWDDFSVDELAVISRTNPIEYLDLASRHLGMTKDQIAILDKAFDEERRMLINAISPMGGLALAGSDEAKKLEDRNEAGLYVRGLVWDPVAGGVAGIYVGRGKETPGCWWDNFEIFTGRETTEGYVVGETKDSGLFFESVDDAVGFMVSSKLVEVPPESAHDTLNMLRNGVADAISCYTPQLPKRHPFKVFKVSDIPTREVKQWSYVCESIEGTEHEQDKLVDTPEFKHWFGKSKIVDGNGKPMVVWHGTRSTFSKFDPHIGELCNPLNRYENVKNGLFFTDNYNMAKAFSNGMEPLTCYLRMERPLIIDAHGEPWIKPIFKFVDGNGMEVAYEDIGKKGVYPYKWVPVHDDLPSCIAKIAEHSIEFADTFSYDQIPSLVNASILRYEYDGVIIKNILEGNGAAEDYETYAGVGGAAHEPNGNDKWACTDYIVLDPRQIKEWHNNGKFSRRTANIYEHVSDEDIAVAKDSPNLSVNGFWDCEDDDDLKIHEAIFQEAVDFANSLPDVIKIYRTVSLHGKPFDKENPGASWSIYPRSALAFGSHAGCDTFIIGEVNKSDCDLVSTIVNYCLYSGSYDGDDENEVVVKDGGERVRVIEMMPTAKAKKLFAEEKIGESRENDDDGAYMSAVKNGDIQKCRQMVREAAARYMPDTCIKEDDGLPSTCYRGIEVDSEKNVDFNFTIAPGNGQYGPGVYVGSSEDVANGYGSYVFELYVDARNIADWDDIWPLFGKSPDEFDNGKDDPTNFEYHPESIQVMIDHGFDGCVDDNGGFCIWNYKNGNVKSARGIEYDDDGNVIPLSKRFDRTKEDVRF